MAHFRRLGQALQASLFALGKRHPFLGPAKLAWEVTEVCNSNCLTCLRRETAPPGELNTDEGLSLLDQAADSGTLSISFTGGEPLIRRDLPLLIRHASHRGLHTSVSTNGILLKGNRLEDLLTSGLRTIYLSLDGARPETNDRLRGVRGGHQRVLDAAAEVLERRAGHVPRVFFNMTVSRANVDELPLMADLAVKTGIDGLTIQPAQIFGQVGLEPDRELTLGAEDADRLASKLRIIKETHGAILPLPNSYLTKMGRFVMDPNTILSIPCVAGYLHAVVGSTGDVYPCPVEFASMGNMKENSLAEIWHGDEAEGLRNRIARGDHPPCWFNCVVPASLVLAELFPFGWAKLLFSPAGGHLLRRIMVEKR